MQLIIAVLLALLVLFFLLGRVALLMLKDAGRDEALREISDRNADVLRKQSEVILEEKSVEEVARDLDRGGF